MNFASDNTVGAAPEILAAIQDANEGAVPSYGADPLTEEVRDQFRAVFDKQDLEVFFVTTGGAANGLALSVLTPPYGMILCHEESHVQMDECAGPEFFTGGAKLLPLGGVAGKLSPQSVEKGLAGFPARPPHGPPAHVLTLTQATECGAVYTCAEVRALCDTARGHGLKVHMDGARFANAVVSLDCSPADATWRAGVDALSFGGTKNGCLAAEAVLFFDPNDADDFAFRQKRAGQLLSKQRFISAQYGAYLKDDLWRRLAGRSNGAAAALSKGLADIEGVRVWYPTDANEVFVSFPTGVADKLRADGAVFYPWVTPGDPSGGRMHRLICSFATTEAAVAAFLEAVKTALSA